MKGHKGHHHHGGRHHAGGGRTKMWVSGNPDVEKEAEDKVGYDSGEKEGKRKGGGIHHRAHRAAGGAAPQRKHGGPVDGHATHHRADRPARGRKRGGAVGADSSPLSTAHRGHPDGHETPDSKDTYGGTPP